MLKKISVFLLSMLFFTNTLYSIEESQIPTSLMEWKAWVLDEVKDIDCPIDYKQGTPQCSWFSDLKVTLHEDQLDFNMSVTLYRDQTKVRLPSAHLSWAKDVLVDGQKASVFGSVATVMLDKGEHKIVGSIPWRGDLKYLQLPQPIALVELYRDGQKVDSPKVDQNARLWLDQEESSLAKEGSLIVSLYRKVIDGHPVRMQTYLHFRVSGKMRSVVLDGIVLDGFLPTAISSSLGATITKEKKLKVELKAGEWTALIDSYIPQHIESLSRPSYQFGYANEEVWTVASDANYRTIEIAGVTSIDPSQTTLPKEWRVLPTYLVGDKAMEIRELYKSAKQQQKNELKLNRELWLDFDGSGYTVSDNIQAKISQIRRLEATSLLDLASASINHKPTLITTLSKSDQKGIELREEKMTIEASSRYEDDISLLPANGWDEEFGSVKAVLNLPAGWRLFASFGSDNQTRAWLESWNLMDIFLVLLLGISIYQLYGLLWSIPATLSLVLLWHEGDAPTVIWLFVLALVALLRVIERGRLRGVLKLLLAVVVSVTILQVLSFSVYEIRTALYPQLEKHYEGIGHYDYPYQEKAILADIDNVVSPQQRGREREYMSMNSVAPTPYIKKKAVKKEYTQIMQNRIDPNAVVQTGIGKPKWRWQSYEFYWQSGVGSDERLELWLISPMLNKFIKFLNILGMLFLLYLFLHEFTRSMMPKIRKNIFSTNGIKVVFLATLLLLSPSRVDADMPSDQMLKALKEKLVITPACLPNCASMESMEVSIIGEMMQIDMSLSAGADIAVPLLGDRNIWLPQEVKLEGNTTEPNLRLDRSGGLWIMLSKGIHQIQLRGSIRGRDQITLSSKLPLHNLRERVEGDAWQISSDHKSYIEINNLTQEVKKEREKSKIEPMVEVERTFYFGQRWYVDTEVKLLNQIDQPYRFIYDLLPHESILDKEIEVKEGRVMLHLGSKNRAYKWRSSLPITDKLELKATNRDELLEIWKMDISSIWDMQYKGIDPIGEESGGDLLMPRFQPWQEESLTLLFEKAKAVRGESLTIESSQLRIAQSGHYRDITLLLKLKSSQAGQYTILLGSAKNLKPTQIDGKTHYLKLNNHKVSIPLEAKDQKVKLSWQEEIGVAKRYQFPTIDLQKESSNSKIELSLPNNQWILWTGGPLLGPAVLLWGVLLAVLLFAIILGRVKGSPLKTRDWLLLGVGVSTSSVMIMLPIIIWIFALRFREYKGDDLQGWRRNFTQIAVVILTVVAISTIIGAVSVGLLGNPEMMITGNHSYGNFLNWYSDRISSTIPEPTVISLSIWYYRVLMLLWSIWIAFSLIKWLKWSWGVFSQGDMWAKRVVKPPRKP